MSYERPASGLQGLSDTLNHSGESERGKGQRTAMEPLTTAELRALYWLARIETASEAAELAGLSAQTLRNQSFSAYKKLGVKGKVEAWRKLGWLRPPQFMPSADDVEFDTRPRVG